jgi:hypothetical protein
MSTTERALASYEPVSQDPVAVLELSRELDQMVEAFAGEHGALLRRACGVPDSVDKLDLVVICTLLGHMLERLSARTGRSHTEIVVEYTLDQIETERQQNARKGTTLQ